MPKNIVLCFDGTNNQFGENNTNIVKLYDLLEKSSEQVAFYDPGIGTIGPSWMARALAFVYKIICLATGWGISENIKDGYQFLMNTYKDGDKIYIFGFSRGAYTARSLAGMIARVGILDVGLKNQVDYAYKMYTDERNHKFSTDFKKTYSTRQPNVYLIGVFDTVGSLAGETLGAIVGGAIGFYLGFTVAPYISSAFSQEISGLFLAIIFGLVFYNIRFIGRFIEKSLLGSHLFHDTKLNKAVKFGFHAIALDEKRWLYSPTLWDETEKVTNQTIEQVWFSGVHVDIGGFYKNHSHTSDNSLAWMIDLSIKAGLKIKDTQWRKLLNPQSKSSLSKNHWFWLITFPIKRKVMKNSKVHRSVLERNGSENVKDYIVTDENQTFF